jgi:hypothetical protein
MLTVDDLKRIFQVTDDQDLAAVFERSPGAVSKWRASGIPASIERKSHELMQARGIVSELPILYSSDAEISEETTKTIDTFVHLDSLTQTMFGRIFDRMKDMTVEEQWKHCADLLTKPQKKEE